MLLKLRFSVLGHKKFKILPPHVLTSKQTDDFFQKFVAFSKYVNFKKIFSYHLYQYSNNKCVLLLFVLHSTFLFPVDYAIQCRKWVPFLQPSKKSLGFQFGVPPWALWKIPPLRVPCQPPERPFEQLFEPYRTLHLKVGNLSNETQLKSSQLTNNISIFSLKSTIQMFYS